MHLYSIHYTYFIHEQTNLATQHYTDPFIDGHNENIEVQQGITFIRNYTNIILSAIRLPLLSIAKILFTTAFTLRTTTTQI